MAPKRVSSLMGCDFPRCKALEQNSGSSGQAEQCFWEKKKKKNYDNHLQYFTAGFYKIEPNFKGIDGISSVTSKPLIVAGSCSLCHTIREQKPQLSLLIKAHLCNHLLGFYSCCNHGPAQAELQCSLLTGTACSTLISADQWS